VTVLTERTWIGSAAQVEEALARAGAEEDQDGQYIILGPKADSLFHQEGDLFIGPETKCICSGRSVPLVDILPESTPIPIEVGDDQQ
jgi:hypothetical protein